MAILSTCCGCHLSSDYGTSVVEGAGSKTSPFKVRQVDPLFKRPVVRSNKTVGASQSIPNNTDTILTFQEVEFDSHLMYSYTQPTRLTARVAGFYSIGADVVWAASATNKEIFFRANGITELNRQTGSSSSGSLVTPQNISYVWFFQPGEFVEVGAFQTSGAGLNVLADGTAQVSSFWMVYLGKKV